MKFIPFDKTTFKTALFEEEVLKRLADNLESKRIRLEKTAGAETFEGEIEGKSFKISRISETGDLFMLAPKIAGFVARDSLKTLITVKIYPHILVLTAGIIFCLLPAVIITAVIISELLKGEFDYRSPAAYILPVLLYFLHSFLFDVENRKAKESLKNLFEAETVKA